MNEYQLKLYNDLIVLSDTDEAFFYKDFYVDETVYRVFNYRLASYTDFLKPSALQCRGIMFEVDPQFITVVAGNPNARVVRLASLPMEKFFNLYENPMTMDLDLSEVDDVELKVDGSLISTYIHDHKLRLKTKGSLESDQAIAAMEFLARHENKEFAEQLLITALLGNTVNMEWCAPDNRIVISYMNAHLRVLNIRNNDTGNYVDYYDLATRSTEFSEVIDRWVEKLDIKDHTKFVSEIPDMEGVEGYVVRLVSTGQRVKIKTEWYLVQHRAKDSINSPRRLFEACIEEATDDLRSLFHDDPLVIQMITEMEEFAEGIYNHTVDSVEKFYAANKGLERKEYAILGQQTLDKKIFGLAMSKYLGRDVDYKEFLRKHYKSFGVAYDPVVMVE